MAIIQLSRMLWLPPRVMIILLMLAQLFYCMIAGVDASILRSVVMINAWVFIRFILLRGCPVLAPLLVAHTCVNYCNAIIGIIAGLLVFIFHHLWLNYGGPKGLGSIWFAACFASVCGGYRSGGVVCAAHSNHSRSAISTVWFGGKCLGFVVWFRDFIGWIGDDYFRGSFSRRFIGRCCKWLKCCCVDNATCFAQLDATPFQFHTHFTG